MKKTGLLVLVAALTVGTAAGQSTGAGSTGTSGSSTTTNGGSSNSPSPVKTPSIGSTPSTSGNSQNTSNPRPVFLSGKVMMDDGSPIPMNVVIQKVCGGAARSVAYTDSRGQFSFQWGQTQAFMADASESAGGRTSGGFGSAQSGGGLNPLAGDPFGTQFTNCELRAQLAGYRSDTINLISRNPMDNPDVGMIVLHRLANVEGISISMTSMMAPKDAKKAYEKGLQALLKNKPDDASKEFEKAVLAYPKYADAWMNLGKIRLQQQSLEPGREAMLKAIESDNKLVAPYMELGMLAAQQQKWEEAAQYLDRGLRLDPIDFPQAWYADAVANFNLKKYDAADRSVQEAGKLDPRHVNPRIQYLRGLILIEKKDYPASADQLRDYLKFAPTSADAGRVKEQIAQIEKYLDQAKEAAKQ